MAKQIVSDERWAVMEPLLPPPKPQPKGGRPPSLPNATDGGKSGTKRPLVVGRHGIPLAVTVGVRQALRRWGGEGSERLGR